MKKKLFLLSAVLLAAAAGVRAQIYSFEIPRPMRGAQRTPG